MLTLVKTLKCQTVLNTKADEAKMLKDFTDTVTELTAGSLKLKFYLREQLLELKKLLMLLTKV